MHENSGTTIQEELEFNIQQSGQGTSCISLSRWHSKLQSSQAGFLNVVFLEGETKTIECSVKGYKVPCSLISLNFSLSYPSFSQIIGAEDDESPDLTKPYSETYYETLQTLLTHKSPLYVKWFQESLFSKLSALS